MGVEILREFYKRAEKVVVPEGYLREKGIEHCFSYPRENRYVKRFNRT